MAHSSVKIDSTNHTNTIDIKVHEFSQQSLEKFLFSPEFEAGGMMWRLVIDIGGSYSGVKDYVGCYLQCTSVGSVTVSFKISAVDQSDDTKSREGSFRKNDHTFNRDHPLSSDDEWSQFEGTERFLEKYFLRAYDLLEDDCLLIRTEITFQKSPPQIEKYDLSSLESDTTDFTITVQGSTGSGDFTQEIKTHKLVLSAFSEVFKSMAYGPMKEAQSNSLVIEDFSVDAVETMVDFLYLGELPEFLKTDLALELLSLSCKYQIDLLKSRCSHYIIRTMKTENALSILSTADALSLSEMKENALEFIGKHFDEIGTSYTGQLYSVEKHLLAEIIEKIATVGFKRSRN